MQRQVVVLRFLVVGVCLGALSCGPGQRSDQGVDARQAVDPVPSVTPPPASPLVASRDELAGVPSFLWADPTLRGFVATAGITDPDTAARTHLRTYASLYRLKPAEVDGLDLRELHDTGRGPIIARFARQVGGVEVWNEVVSVAMDRQLDAVALTGFVTGDAPAAHKRGASFGLSAHRAAAIVLGDAAATAADPATVKKVWFRTADRALLDAYYLEVDHGNDATGAPRYFSYVVSATDGAVLYQHDLTAYDHPVTYRVWADNAPLPLPADGPQGNATTPLPGAAANGYTVPFVAPSTITVSSLTSIGVFDDWLPPGATETLGNNVDAYADLVTPDGFTPGTDFRADVTGPNLFDRVLDVAADPTLNDTQRKAAITQLFYNVNFWHDWYYAAGFDERAGNAQAVNYGRGGVQGDAIRGEAQDSSSKNNANMSTPADGGRPRMQMFLWDFSPSRLTIASPAPALFENLGQASGWGSLNFNLPDTTAIVRGVPNEGCTALTGTYTGTIVVLDRGTCGFSVKAASAEAAGAAGVIIANVAASGNPTVPPGMALTAGQTPPTIPAFSINLADGDAVRTALAAGPVTGGMARVTSLRDGDIDNQVMAHEWGHYISNRLVFNANGLGSNMARGLGEGWADVHALLMTVRPGDDLEPTNATWNGVYAMAAYASAGGSRGNPYYFGIRRYPYSTDMTKNPLTFRHIGDGNALPVGPPVNLNPGTNAEVHNTGEVWTTMVWECYAALLRDTQGATPRLTFDQARDRFRDYLVAAYKITPANPTLLEARDALLAVALATDATDYARFTVAFAKRGAGVYAVAPDRNSATNMPVVESFGVGAALAASTATVTDDVDPACNADGVLDEGEIGTLTVTFRNVGNSAVAATTATVSSTTAGVTFPSGTTITIPAAAQFQTVTATLPIAAGGLTPVPTTYAITITSPDLGGGAPAPVTFSVLGNYDVVGNSSFTDSVEPSTTTWTVGKSPSTLGASEVWQRTTLSATDHRWVAASASQAGTSDLTSATLFVLPGQPLVLSFRHRFSFESPVFDGGVIEVSTDGGTTWTDAGTAAGYNGTLGNASANPLGGRAAYVNQSAGYPAFVNQTVNLGTTYSGRSVLLRFRVASDAGTSSAGWDLDDLQVAGVSAPPFATLVGQPAACNNAPLANAGLSRSVGELTASPLFGPVTVSLDGSASFDADGQPLVYQWLQVGGLPMVLSDAAARIPTFTAPLIARAQSPVSLVFQLTVSDGTSTSAPSFVGINITNVNRPPVAAAGAAQQVDERTVVTLDGSASSDLDTDDTLAFAWTQTAGPAVTLSSTTAARPTFTAPEVTIATALTFRLIVNDGLTGSLASTVTVTVRDLNQAPAASAGSTQTVPELTPTFDPVTVTLDASASTDPEGSALTYAWTQTGGPAVTLSDPTAAQPTFTAPSVPRAGTTVLTFQVAVSDAAPATSTATTTVTVTNVNRPPVAAAGPAQTADERTVVTLDGTGSSDPDSDDTVTHAWTQTAGPTVTLSSATVAQPTFTAPDVNGDTTLTFELVAGDGLATSAAASVVITVHDVNLAPVADAGADQTAPERTVVTLDGSASDPDNDTPLTYAWTAPAGVVLSSATDAAPTFTAPDVTVVTPYTFTLVVADPSLATSAPATVTVLVTNVNRPPVADAGAAASARSGQVVALLGTATDPDGDVAFAWTWTAPAGITLNDATSATPTFVAPTVTAATTYDFTLVVTDASGAVSPSSSVTITVDPALRPPVADAGIAITAPSGGQVELDGSASADPDGGVLTYQWTQIGGPAVVLNDATAAQPHFTAPLVTVSIPLTFQLVVTNPASTVSAPDTVSVFVEANPDSDDGGCCSAGGSPGAGPFLLAGLLVPFLVRRRRGRQLVSRRV